MAWRKRGWFDVRVHEKNATMTRSQATLDAVCNHLVVVFLFVGVSKRPADMPQTEVLTGHVSHSMLKYAPRYLYLMHSSFLPIFPHTFTLQ
jgi:hypothetical protein